MAARDWKPGDVAVLAMGKGGVVPIIAIRCSSNYWVDCEGVTVEDGEPWGVRRLVVIDPEDREQVERLRDALPVEWNLTQPDDPEVGDESTDAMQAALREFANPKPPKPDEPTGRYAEVQNAEGMTYYRSPAGSWRRSSDDLVRDWQAIGAVRVLSEGVTQ